MSFFSSIGKKFRNGFHAVTNFGKKVVGSVHHAVSSIGKKVSNFAVSVGNKGAKIAHKVGHIAGDYIAPIAGTIGLATKGVSLALDATGVGAPIGAVLGGIGSLATNVSRGARAVQLGSYIAEKGFKGASNLGRKGQKYFK